MIATTTALPVSERRRAAYFLFGAVPSLYIGLVRVVDMFQDPSSILFALPSLAYLVGIGVWLGWNRAAPPKIALLAAALVATGALQWLYEIATYRFQDYVRNLAGDWPILASLLFAMFVTPVVVGAHGIYRTARHLASNNTLVRTHER